MAVTFIPDELVPDIHRILIQRYGGSLGIRDPRLLASALAQPKMTVGRKFVHRTVFDKAAAYGYHLCANHPFIDGNKRVAFTVMFLFLEKNGYTLEATEEDAYRTMISIASGRLKKPTLAAWLRSTSKRTAR
ncbi:MAG: type II toxin-antitoxin system death-on-curing family toxin [Acidobacteriota bacterium]